MPPATPVRFMDRAHILMSDGWVVRAASHPEHMHTLLSAASKPTTSPSKPKRVSKKRQAATSSTCVYNLGIRRGKQRWRALVSAPTSRLSKMMRPLLGDAAWSAFVSHANKYYKAAYVGAFDNSVLRCVGPMDGGECPHTFEVNFNAPDAVEKIASLHLDHERPVHITCAWWAAQLPKHVNGWMDGIDGGELCHALFGVQDDNIYGRRCVQFRCGPREKCFAQHSYCHRS